MMPEAERGVRPDPPRGGLELAAGCPYEAGGYPNAYQWVEPWLEKRKASGYHGR